MFKIFIIVVTVLLTSCIAMPVMNNVIPMNEGEKNTTASTGGVFFAEGLNEPMPYIYGSIQYKYENTSFEISTWGVKAIQDLSNKNNFYIASFQSLYLAMIGVGTNAGMLFSYSFNDARIYLSGRIDAVFIPPVIDGMTDDIGFYLNLTPTAGIVFDTFERKMFLEFIYSHPLLNSPNKSRNSETDEIEESPNVLYSEFFFSLQLGMSF